MSVYIAVTSSSEKNLGLVKFIAQNYPKVTSKLNINVGNPTASSF